MQRGFNEVLWFMATGRATREALLSEAGFEKVLPDPELGPSEPAVLWIDFVSCWGKRVHIGCCLNPVVTSFRLVA